MFKNVNFTLFTTKKVYLHSQFGPVKFPVQVQKYENDPSVHVPEFWQGLEAHSFVSFTKMSTSGCSGKGTLMLTLFKIAQASLTFTIIDRK